MAFFDWNGNGNGKKDMGDDFIEYKVYESCTQDKDLDTDDSNPNSGGCCSSLLAMVCILLVVLGLLSQCTVCM